jgi:hypothetical protein
MKTKSVTPEVGSGIGETTVMGEGLSPVRCLAKLGLDLCLEALQSTEQRQFMSWIDRCAVSAPDPSHDYAKSPSVGDW